MTDNTSARVTDDPDLEAELFRLFETTMDSRALAEHAHSLGLYPPGYGPRMDPPIVLAWPPNAPDGGHGILIWDMGDDDDEQAADEE